MEKKLSAALKWKELEMTVWLMKTMTEQLEEVAIEWATTETNHNVDLLSKNMKSSSNKEWLKRWKCSGSQSLRQRHFLIRTPIWKASY